LNISYFYVVYTANIVVFIFLKQKKIKTIQKVKPLGLKGK